MIFRAAFLIMLLIASVLRADELESGKVYTGPMKLSAPNLGASLMLPKEWQAQLVSARGPLVLQSQASASRILVEANVSVIGNPLAMLSEKMEYYGLDLLSLAQIRKVSATQYYRLYQVSGSPDFSQALLYLVLGSQKRAVLLHGFFVPGEYDSIRRIMMALSDSLGFTTIRALPWQMGTLYLQIGGGHFVFYERRSSFSEKREVWLCRNGKVIFKGQYTVANNTSRTTEVRRGKWHLDGNRLVLDLEGGMRKRYRVTMKENTLFFDGSQTFRLPNYGCK
jgi:hypothetical protein